MMRFSDQLRSLRDTFAARRGRVALTLLGVVIGSGSIVLLPALLQSGEEVLLAGSQEATDADLLRVDVDEPPAKERHKTQRSLSESDAELLAAAQSLDGAAVASERGRWTEAHLGAKRKRIDLVASAPIALSLYRLGVGQGRFLVADDLGQRRRVCVVGANVWRDLAGGRPSLDGAALEIDGVSWSVVGVLQNKPGMGSSGDGPWMWNNKVLVPRTTWDATFYDRHRADRIFVRVAGVGPLETRLANAERSIRALLLERHYGVHNFKLGGADGQRAQRELIVAVIEILLFATALLSLFVGGINIMNVMLVAVTERTREIGVRRAVGASRGSVMAQFVLESAVIAGAGGVVGVLGGSGIAAAVAAVLARLFGRWPLHVQGWSVALALALAAVTGVVFGVVPARRAARLDPIEALRSE